MDSQVLISYVPADHRSLLPPVRFNWASYLDFDASVSADLAELEARYPVRRVFTIQDRQHSLLRRRPR